MRFDRRYLLACLLLLLGAFAFAQSDDESGEENETDNPASLSMVFDNHGGMQASLTFPASVKDPDSLIPILEQALRCPAGVLRHPDSSRYESFQKNWSTARRERYRQQVEEYNHRVLSGHCDAARGNAEYTFGGDFDLSRAVAEMRQGGVDQLAVYVSLPKSQFSEYTKTNLLETPGVRSLTSLVYQIPVAESSKPAVLHFAFGFRRADFYRALAILAAFLLIPVLFTLWMRHRALALAKVDAPGAWFGFFRTLNWLVTGAGLAWITSGLGARQTLQDWVELQRLTFLVAAVADVAISIVPPFVLYFLCLSLSYRVHAQLRGTQWTRREFVSQHLVTAGSQVVPLLLGISGLVIVSKQPRLGASLLIAAFFVFQAFQMLRLRVMKAFPQPLTTGGLRDRIFALAGRLGVTVNQIFVLPAGKGQVANAFAARNRIVMFTDYLLEHLNKREVDGVAAHELAHLRYKHPAKLGFALMGAIFLPYYFEWLARTAVGFLSVPLALLPAVSGRGPVIYQLYRGLNRLEQIPQKDLLLLIMGMTGFYFLSRRFENVADATAVRLTGDAEAQITGLLKLNRLNLIPVRWGKASESWLTHPSTYRRAHRMAAAGGLAPERLQEILHQYEFQNSALKLVPPEDRYGVPFASDPEKMRVAMRDRTRTQGKFWLHLAIHVLPLALISLLIPKAHLSLLPELLAYLGGVLLAAGLVILGGVWLGEAGKGPQKKHLIQRFEREHIPAGYAGDAVVGFAPGPHPRIFSTRYHWDSGFLIFARDRLQFVGEQIKFSFSREEIDGVVMGRGGPSWWRFERIYVRWKTQDGGNGIFNLNSLEPGSIWQTNRTVRDLYRRIEQWRERSGNYPETRPELQDLKRLELGQVTSISPARLGGFKINLTLLWLLILLAIGVSVLTHADMWYLIASMFVLRLIESVPYWRYRDVVPSFPQISEATSKARSAAQT